MELSDLTKYAKEKYHIKEEFKWTDFPGFSVLSHPRTGKWVALLMRQWDYESGTEIQRCDIKCGRQEVPGPGAPFLKKAFRMKGEKWVGVQFDRSTDPQVVFRLFDRAVNMEGERGFKIVLDNTQNQSKDSYRDTLLPLEGLRGNYRKKEPGVSANKGGIASGIPRRFIEMMELYDYTDKSFEGKCRNFCRQGRFMEDYEDDASWDREFYRYFTTYHDLNYLQLRGYFAWRAKVRRGEFHPIATSLAYMYIYELLNGIGADSPAESLHKIREFEAGYVDSGIGEASMRENLQRWELEFAVVKDLPKEEVLPFADPFGLKRDRLLVILQKPSESSDEEIFEALSELTGNKILKSPVITKCGDRGKHLFAEVWRYMSEHYRLDGWDLFTACFGRIRKYPWHPLANAIYLHDSGRRDTVYELNECRRYVFRSGVWTEERYDSLFFDKYRIHAVVHETDRVLRLYLKTGHKLREKAGEDWITPYVEAVTEADKAAARKVEKPGITIDLSGLEKIRHDAQITRDSLLTEEETQEISFHEEQISDTIEIPSLDKVQGQILLAVLRGKPVEGLIREHHLMASVVTDAINEAVFEEVGDNVLECEGDRITLVEDYREDLVRLIGGDI